MVESHLPTLPASISDLSASEDRNAPGADSSLAPESRRKSAQLEGGYLPSEASSECCSLRLDPPRVASPRTGGMYG